MAHTTVKQFTSMMIALTSYRNIISPFIEYQIISYQICQVHSVSVSHFPLWPLIHRSKYVTIQ